MIRHLLAWYLHRRWRIKNAWRHPSPPHDYGNHVPPRGLSRYQIIIPAAEGDRFPFDRKKAVEMARAIQRRLGEVSR